MAARFRTQVQSWDKIRHNLIEEFDTAPHVFDQVIELSRKYMYTSEGNQLPQNGNEYFDRLENRMTKMDMLNFLIGVLGQLNLHTDMGTVSQEQVLRGYKETLEECLRAEVEDEEESRKFVGRKKYIDDIVKMFVDDRNIYKGVSIYGMGGLGKTTLANHICRKLKQEWRIVKVDLRGVYLLRDMLRYIFVQLTCQTLHGGDVEEILDRIKEFLKKDNAIERKTLLFLDNVEDVMNSMNGEGRPRFLKDFLDNFMNFMRDYGDKCKIRLMLTSRLSLFDHRLLPRALIDFWRSVNRHGRRYGLIIEKELHPVETSEAVELFMNCIGENPDAKKHVEKIVKLCGCSPIAITILCKSMLHDGLTPESVLHDLEPNFWHRHISRTPNVTECLERSFDSLRKNEQRNLIRLSVFHSASFDLAAAEAVFRTTSSTPESTADTRGKLAFLKLRSFIEVSEHELTVRYSLHPLVFYLLKRKAQSKQFRRDFQIAKERFVEYFRKFICDVAKEMDKDCRKGHKKLGYDMKHVKNFYEFMATDDLQKLLISQFTNNMTTIVESRRIYEIADILLYDDTKWSLIQNFITKTKASMESQLHHFFWRICEIAVLLDLDRNQEASKKIDTLDNELSRGKLEVVDASAMAVVEGSLLFQRGRYYRREYECEKAIHYLKLAEEKIVREKKDHKVLLSKIYNVMGGSEYRKKKANYTKARELHEKALIELVGFYKRWYNIETQEYLQNIGTCYFKQGESLHKRGRKIEAEEYYQKAINMYDVAIILSTKMKLDKMECHAQILQNRGEAYCAKECWDKAQEDLKNCMLLRQRILSHSHRQLTIVYFKTAQLLYKKGVWFYHQNDKDQARESMLWGKGLCVKIAEFTTKGSLPINDIHYQEVKELTFKLLDTLQDPQTFREIQNKYRKLEKGAFDKHIRKSRSIANSHFTQNKKYGTTWREPQNKMQCDSSSSDSDSSDDDDDCNDDDAANQNTRNMSKDDSGVPLYKMTEREKAVDLTGVTYVGNTRYIGYDQHHPFNAAPQECAEEDINIEEVIISLIPNIDTMGIDDESCDNESNDDDDNADVMHLNSIIEQVNIHSRNIDENGDRGKYDTGIRERTVSCMDTCIEMSDFTPMDTKGHNDKGHENVSVTHADIHAEQMADPALKEFHINIDHGNPDLANDDEKDSDPEETECTSFIQQTRKRNVKQLGLEPHFPKPGEEEIMIQGKRRYQQGSNN